MNQSEYVQVRRQIADRMRRLGYSHERFRDVDQLIAGRAHHQRDAGKTDRYGKKYSWIAYFEMYGLRSAAGELDDDHYRFEFRTSDCDVDPSFPVSTPVWDPP